MALRPDNHITGYKAIRKISDRLIPEEWTISIPDSDYGLDMLIEVVSGHRVPYPALVPKPSLYHALFYLQYRELRVAYNRNVLHS